MGVTVPDLEHWVQDFSPGYLDTPEEDTLPRGASPDARNAEFARIEYGRSGQPRRATLKKRSGLRLLNPTVMDSQAKVDGLFEFRRTGAARELVAACNGKVKVFDYTDTFTQVGATAPFTAGRAARACFFRDNAIIHDGDAMQRYNGTALLALGFAAPTSATSANASVAPSCGGKPVLGSPGATVAAPST